MSDAASAILLAAVEGSELGPAERAFFERESPAGATLFARNLPDAGAGSAELIRALQGTRPAGEPPLVVAVDQEGGRVSRLGAPFPNEGPAGALAGGADHAQALAELEAYGVRVGRALAALGFNVNFAPVVDVLTRPANRAIGDRAFGRDPAAVSARAGAFLRGLQSSGVAGCLKHFPGQGDAADDTHECGTRVEAARALLDARELLPFRALVGEAQLVMLSHCTYPELCSREASRSPRIIGELLRGELGFAGTVVSDDMNMGAIPQDERAWQEALADSVAAGVDLLLVCRHLERARLALEGLRAQARRSPALAERLRESAARNRRLRARLICGAAA